MNWDAVLRDIKPTKKEEQQLTSLVNTVLQKITLPHVTPILGGSGAKKTWLKNTHDIDIYAKFNHHHYKDRSDKLSDLLHAAIKKKLPRVTRLHGSRDYFQLKIKNYTVEVVPILDISSPQQAQNTTDFSQLHVTYVLKHINKNKRLADDIRLAKQYAKANHVYGAESYIRGFSGYVLELLTIHYGSFMNLIKAAAQWKPSTIIGSKAKANQLNPSKRSCLIVMDPVQPGRNAAAALCEEKFYDFIMAARAFLRHPSPSSFKEKPFDVAALRNLGTVVQLDVKPLSGNQDIVGTKLMKAFEFIRRGMKHYDFTLLAAKWTFDPDKKRASFYYVVDKHELPEMKKYWGPPITNQQAVAAFTKAHTNVKHANDRLYALEKRLYTSIMPLLKTLIKSSNVTSRVKAIHIIQPKKKK